ncbi:MAG: carboxymuconolactone decarboxylase family protein [Rhodospirillaceae bacterium]|jgi:4-carboxymuconolactone decarboxylase|nr:carboxymuconolactone decarboxylase family protein [Rhodospirillaceae bacterium]MBT5459004.1 carboxymuconolactone decarboxylase family protein [Rhodospirillaceae bacterium]
MMPSDIDPVSGFRLPFPDREALDDDAKALYDRFCDPDGGSYVGLRGPGGIRLHSPQLALRTQNINTYLRRDAGIPLANRELSILVTAREFDSQFEWCAHEDEALKAGISPEVIEIVRHRKPIDDLPEEQYLIIQLGREMFGDHKVTSETFARALALWGERHLLDFVSVMANYANTAAILCVFDMQLPEGKEPGLPALD